MTSCLGYPLYPLIEPFFHQCVFVGFTIHIVSLVNNLISVIKKKQTSQLMFLDGWGHTAPAEVTFSLPPEHSEYFSLFTLSDVSSTCHLNVVRLCLREL